MLTYLPSYHVLICNHHHCAVHGLDKHFKELHKLPAYARRDLLAPYHHLPLLPPDKVPTPEHNSAPLPELGTPADTLACCYRSATTSLSSSSSSSSGAACTFISTSRRKMQQHLNQQHNVKLTRWTSLSAPSYDHHAAQLWRPVKVQTFFRSRRYIRYFIVQEQEQQQQQ